MNHTTGHSKMVSVNNVDAIEDCNQCNSEYECTSCDSDSIPTAMGDSCTDPIVGCMSLSDEY